MAEWVQVLLFDNDQEAAKSLLSDLLERSRLYHTSKAYKDLLEFTVRLRNFAPFNAFLLHLQKPGLRFAASEYDWRQRFKRTVKEGARPLLILWPFGPVALVYDLEDTEGDPLPDSVADAFRASGTITKGQIDQFKSRLARQGIHFQLIEYGDAHAGHIRGEPSTDPKQRRNYQVRLNSKHNPNVQFATLAHELAHLYLGHLGPDAYLKIPERGRLEHDQKELEAESVSYLVCCRNHIHSEAEEYLSNYVQNHPTVAALDLYLTLKAAGNIEAALDLGETIRFRPKR